MSHKFGLHQRVKIDSATATARASPDGIYDIVQLMPQSQDGSFTYRLRSSAGDRVAAESVIIPVPPQAS